MWKILLLNKDRRKKKTYSSCFQSVSIYFLSRKVSNIWKVNLHLQIWKITFLLKHTAHRVRVQSVCRQTLAVKYITKSYTHFCCSLQIAPSPQTVLLQPCWVTSNYIICLPQYKKEKMHSVQHKAGGQAMTEPALHPVWQIAALSAQQYLTALVEK